MKKIKIGAPILVKSVFNQLALRIMERSGEEPCLLFPFWVLQLML
ncbi:MAG: hypothetical protein BWY80_00641 [Firmicutes bacterium ADurb.Bin456]|nr:MAG: hypothetical protein BWY80_00641 [Firmicutes bacterium ADurb.Bin456]